MFGVVVLKVNIPLENVYKLAIFVLTLKVPITTAADGIHKYFFRENKTYVSSDSSARQRINMKNQALFSLKDKSKN